MKVIFPELKKSWNDACPVMAIERNPWEEQYYCFDDGPSDGAGSGAEGDPRPDTVASGNQPKDTGGGFRSPGDVPDRQDMGQGKASTFGVDGRSITGSADLDAKLGYTSAPGSGKPGPNYDALNAATAEELAAAKQTAGLIDGDDLTSRTNARDAVANTLANYTPGDVTQAGNFTDQGAQKAQANIQAALDARAAQTQVSADRILGVGDVTAPTFGGIGPRPRANVSVVGRGPLNPALSNVSANILGRRAISTSPLEIEGVTVDSATAVAELQNRALAGDEEAKAELDNAVQAGINTAGMVGIPSVNAGITPTGVVGVAPGGIAAAPQATARNVLGNIQNQIIEAGIQTGGRGQPGQDPNFLNDALQAAVSASEGAYIERVPDIFTSPPMGRASRTTAPATSTTVPVADPNAPGQLTAEQLANLDRFGVDDEAGAMGMRGPGSGYTAGLPDNLQFVDTNQGRFTTNLAGTTQAQREATPGYMSTRDSADPISGEVREGFVPTAVDFLTGNPVTQAYGFEIPGYQSGNPNMDPTITGVVGRPNINVPSLLGTGLSFLESTLLDDPSQYGSSAELLTGMTPRVYTGFGPGSEMGIDPDAGGDAPPKAPNDPCPPGFQLINGTCTPVGGGQDDQGQEEAGSSFQINPTTGLPTLFTPFTQATPVGQMNPFVLQPYTPGQAATIGASRAAQGIQALSPTGAALGRQI